MYLLLCCLSISNNPMSICFRENIIGNWVVREMRRPAGRYLKPGNLILLMAGRSFLNLLILNRAPVISYVGRNKHITNTVTIDLHGQHVKQAMKLLKVHMLVCVCMPCECSHKFGCCNHCPPNFFSFTGLGLMFSHLYHVFLFLFLKQLPFLE
jgi:hypothetical protein